MGLSSSRKITKKSCRFWSEANRALLAEPGHYLVAKDYDFVLVNPMHVKKLKEVDDNSPTKNDTEDARVIAQLYKWN
ncbi:transposase [Lentibacillus sp. L22]|uniref:IS110 family transposase n=1 Tax=Lentibacillus TaxID=175304 RepID=UPI0034666E43